MKFPFFCFNFKCRSLINPFDFNDGKIIYSSSREVDYINQDIEMCIFLDNTGDFIIGNYSVELYLENNLIGRTNFMLSRR
jgi:hypothetical protein